MRKHACVIGSSPLPDVVTSDLSFLFYVFSNPTQPGLRASGVVLSFNDPLPHYTPHLRLSHASSTYVTHKILSNHPPPFRPTLCRIRPFFLVSRLSHACHWAHTVPCTPCRFFHFYLQLSHTLFVLYMCTAPACRFLFFSLCGQTKRMNKKHNLSPTNFCSFFFFRSISRMKPVSHNKSSGLLPFCFLSIATRLLSIHCS